MNQQEQKRIARKKETAADMRLILREDIKRGAVVVERDEKGVNIKLKNGLVVKVTRVKN